jgi:hypothetical protein
VPEGSAVPDPVTDADTVERPGGGGRGSAAGDQA